ncbi:MAG TPA: hypothetical protein VK733_02915 [Gemmatimonadaceae bacterium]|nr:hypothetical protein [Gemmatimonadaceae bacterium]
MPSFFALVPKPRIAFLVALVACSAPASGPSSNGRLTVTIVAPAGVTANVQVSGPAGYARSLHATETLTGLTGGAYVVTGAVVSMPGAIVGATTDSATVTGSPATVTAGQVASVNVTYGAPSSSGGLWIANYVGGTGFAELAASTLGASTTAPSLTRHVIATSDADGPKSIAFDPAGNLWVVLTRTPVEDTVLPAVLELTRAQLDSAAPTPSVVLADTSLTLTGGLAFDTAGNVWIASVDNCEIVEYAAGQLAAPTLKLTRHCASPVIGPNALAFDAHGNLWVGDIATHTLYEYPRAASSPTIVIGLPSMAMPAAIAFDAAGDLWVTSNDSTVYDYTPGQLAASGSPTPTTTLAISGTRLVSLAFDNSGDLWLANFATSTIDELSASQLRSSGTVTPVTVISGPGSVNAPTGLAFSPRVSGLPLFTRRR